MGYSYTLLLNPEVVTVPRFPLELVFPLQWMHNLIKHPVLGGQKTFKIVMDFMVNWESDAIDPQVNWVKYGITNPNKKNAEHATPDELTGWIKALSETITAEIGKASNSAPPNFIQDLLLEIVPFSVLTGWDMNIGQQNWDALIFLLSKYPDMANIKVQIAEHNIVSVMISDAVDEDLSLRVVSLKGWDDWKVPSGTVSLTSYQVADRQKYDSVTNFLSKIGVFPKGLYTWSPGAEQFFASINKKVIT